MEKNIEISESGLQCDNPNCDWIDPTITFDNYKDWLNKPCPKCGENLLTDEDYKRAEALRLTVDFINSLSEGELGKLNESIGLNSLQDLKNIPMFKDAKGIDEVKDEGEIIMSVSSHNEIKVDEIKNVDYPENPEL